MQGQNQQGSPVLAVLASLSRWLPSSCNGARGSGQDRAHCVCRAPLGLDSTDFLGQCLRLPFRVCPTPNPKLQLVLSLGEGD